MLSVVIAGRPSALSPSAFDSSFALLSAGASLLVYFLSEHPASVEIPNTIASAALNNCFLFMIKPPIKYVFYNKHLMYVYSPVIPVLSILSTKRLCKIRYIISSGSMLSIVPAILIDSLISAIPLPATALASA